MSFAVPGNRAREVAFHGAPAGESLGHARSQQRAFVALGGISRARRDASSIELVHPRREGFGFLAQGGRKSHVLPPPRSAVIQRSISDRRFKHLFQAKSLCAQLDLVAMIRLWPAALVFHGERLPE